MVEQVTVDDLALVSYYIDDFSSPEVHEWKRRAPVFIAENCRRQFYLGTKADFEDFPGLDQDNAATVHTGADAYAALLEYISGFEGARVGETHVKKQFYGAWTGFQAKFPEVALRYERFMGQLKEDANFIRDEVIANFKFKKHELCARDLSDQKKGQSILIVASSGRGDNSLGIMTESMIRATENKQIPNKKRPRDNFLAITHPDEEVLLDMAIDLEARKEVGRVKSTITPVPFVDMASWFETYDRVYVDLPMAQDLEADALMIAAWLGRVRDDSVLTHLRGDPYSRGLSTDLWKDADLDDYVSPEDIREEMMKRGRENAMYIERARRAFLECGVMRSEGIRPKTNLSFADETADGGEPELVVS